MHGGHRDLKKGGANGYLRRSRDHGKGLGDIKAAALLLDIGLDQLAVRVSMAFLLPSPISRWIMINVLTYSL